MVAKDLVSALSETERAGFELVRSALQALTSICDLEHQPQVALVPSGSSPGGQPRYNIPMRQVQFLLENRFTVPQVSEMLGASGSTIRRRMSEYHLSVRDQYATVTDQELDEMIGEIREQFPTRGNNKLRGTCLPEYLGSSKREYVIPSAELIPRGQL